jgi:formylglycine-generating enzyme required for sulfatase activity
MRGWTEPTTPVINVTWRDAKEYTAWLARRTRKPYRLLSEAEWEYVARAGSDTTYPTGATIKAEQANFAALGKSARRPVAVGSYPANAFGVSDMMGNVWEWVEDTWHPTYDKAPADGRPWGGGDQRFRVLRGGSWGDGGEDLRVGYRNPYTPETRSDLFGFRVARALADAEVMRAKRQ